jgi:hypothetical protein
MARNIRLTPYDEQMIDAFDEDASSPEYVAYGSSSTATESYFPPEDSMPLFLSDDTEEEAPRQRVFVTGVELNRNGTAWPRILKAGFYGGGRRRDCIRGEPAALLPRQASLIGTSAGQAGVPVKSASEPAAPVRLASAEPQAPATQTTVGARTSLPAATSTPTRDEIAAALRNAHQSQPEIRQPPAVASVAQAAPPVAAPPARHLAPDELAALLKRAKGLIEVGDIAPARLLLERAADAQEATAALLLAQTYDPAVLGALDMRSITPDPDMARSWYQKAARFGSLDAQQRLAQMQN